MTARVLMLQGTGSDVGKSTLVTGLCAIAHRRGIKVAPFKPQNMSNNAAACVGGGEIGRAQALQARAAGITAHTDLNPVLLKPESDQSCQVVVHGEVFATLSAKAYMNEFRATLLSAVTESFWRLATEYDLILVEGAGSPAEVNLRENDIANMGFARVVQAPVCLVGDIDRGGVIAAIVGTRAVIDHDDATLITSCIINRFRGDPTLFEDGVKIIEQLSGWPCHGVVPWLRAATRLPSEDAVVLETTPDPIAASQKLVRIAVPMLSRIANFDDVDPLRSESNVALTFVAPGQALPLDVDVIILPGTKSTLADLAFVRDEGWDHDLIAFARSGGRIMGLCGGYQMLGRMIHDPLGLEGAPTSGKGLGLLDVETKMTRQKRITPVQGTCARSGLSVSGYEIHIGTTTGLDTARPLCHLSVAGDGATSSNGRIEGTYVHGIFANDKFRSWWLDQLRTGSASRLNYEAELDADLTTLADGLESSLNIEALLNSASVPRG